MLNIKNIVVPTDFSKLSFSALEYSLELADKMNAKIHLIYVLERMPAFLSVKDSNTTEEEIIHSMEEEAKAKLHETALFYSDDSNLRIIEVCRKGNDYEEIVNYAAEVKADLIIIATHGRTGVLHTLLGSVAEKVIRYAKCPVLVIKPPEEE